MRAFVDQALDVGRLVDVVAVLLAQLSERLDADRQSAFRHPPIVPHRVVARNSGRAAAAPGPSGASKSNPIDPKAAVPARCDERVAGEVKLHECLERSGRRCGFPH